MYSSLSCEHFAVSVVSFVYTHQLYIVCLRTMCCCKYCVARLPLFTYISHRDLQRDLISHRDYELICIMLHIRLHFYTLLHFLQCYETYVTCFTHASYRFLLIFLYSPHPLVCLYSQRCIRRDRLVVAARQRIQQVFLPCVCHTSLLLACCSYTH